MKNEEVDRLFRVASEAIRTKWEAQRNAGQSLLEVKKDRETALVKEAEYGKKRNLWFRLLLLSFCLIMFLGWYFDIKNGRELAYYAVTMSIILGPISTMYVRTENAWFKQVNTVANYDGVLQQFALSLAALNPLGTGNNYHDVIDESYVKRRANTLAIRVVDAQTTFDALRKNPEAGRYSVIHAGEWIGKCEADLEKFESNLNKDFGLSLDKPSIFKDAEVYLAKARLKV